jgi:hypothetical protein
VLQLQEDKTKEWLKIVNKRKYVCQDKECGTIITIQAKGDLAESIICPCDKIMPASK